jgi:hypothetical protein
MTPIIVMAGLVPAISIQMAMSCRHYRDCRIKSGNDEPPKKEKLPLPVRGGRAFGLLVVDY